jgi:hypothetical protein
MIVWIWRDPERASRRARRVAPTASQAALAILILIAPALLLAIAYASPPDPAWIPGIYDDADHDDVVVQITSGTANVAALPPLPSGVELSLAERVPPLVEPVVAGSSPSAIHSRAPPFRIRTRSTTSS